MALLAKSARGGGGVGHVKYTFGGGGGLPQQ